LKLAAATKKSRKPRAKSKSAAVRAYFDQHAAAGPTEVSKALKKQGIDISPAHVSNVKAGMKRKAGMNGGATGRRGRPTRGGSDAISLSNLLEARSFVVRVGGIEEASALVAALAKLSSTN
jgi:hypothetical protein